MTFSTNSSDDSYKPPPPLPNYYVLYILASGVLDDLEETFEECAGIERLPLSIIFVKIGNTQMRDVDDLMEL